MTHSFKIQIEKTEFTGESNSQKSNFEDLKPFLSEVCKKTACILQRKLMKFAFSLVSSCLKNNLVYQLKAFSAVGNYGSSKYSKSLVDS